MRQKDCVFLINLPQDVNIVRGLVYLAVRETDCRIRFLVSERCLKRDVYKTWQQEIGAVANDTGAEVFFFSTTADVQAVLQGRGGLLIAASESNLSAHWETRDAFCVAPSSYLKITLQHGLECVGFRQSREHILGHGRDITFNADIVCAWLQPDKLNSTTISQRAKVIVTGPPTLLQRRRPRPDHPPVSGGLICENMHSVRLQASGDHKASFLETFFEYCKHLAAQGRDVTLRPHPGGQYMLKQKYDLPKNVHLNNLPIYDVDLASYQYGISAPSTVLLDMVLAGIPTAVWRDEEDIIDATNYSGLTEVRTLGDWLSFEAESRLNPEPALARQRAFLEQTGILRDPTEVYRRFARLFRNALSGGALSFGRSVSAIAVDEQQKIVNPPPERVLFFVNGVIPTLQFSFLKPLNSFFQSGKMAHEIITELELNKKFGDQRFSKEAAEWVEKRIADFNPDLIVCCRYSGPHSKRILSTARARAVPVIFSVDDDLLNIPPELGEKKFKFHNDPKRLTSVRLQLDGATMIYCSAPELRRRLKRQGVSTPIFQCDIINAARIHRAPTEGPVKRIGYMGFDHAHDLLVPQAAIEDYLEEHPNVEFEIFGSIPMPQELARFGDRVRAIPPVRDYPEFMKALAAREWDIGICPLAHTPFNQVKTDVKWIEYTACGIATIATKGMVYDECAAEGRGLLVSSGEWRDALQLLTDNPQLRYRMMLQAQTHLLLNYSEDRLTRQVLRGFDQALMLFHGSKLQAGEPQRARPLRQDEARNLVEV